MNKFRIAAWFCALAVGIGGSLAQAQGDYPNKPLRIVVTFPPGGSTDVVARLLATRLTEKMGQQVLVENRPGAGGNIGLALVAKAPADGYTLGIGAAGGLSANISLYPNMPFDPLRDFKPVSLLVAIPFVIVGHPGVAAKSQRELIALARSQPGKLSMGHGGNGTAMHLTSALFNQKAAVRIQLVAYRGTAPAAVDVLAGHIPLAVLDIPASLQLIRDGKLKALGVSASKRVVFLPDVPPLSELGLSGFESVGWFGIVARAGTPPDIIKRLNAAFVKALNDPAAIEKIRILGAEPAPSSAEAFAQFIQNESAKWGKLISEAGIKSE